MFRSNHDEISHRDLYNRINTLEANTDNILKDLASNSVKMDVAIESINSLKVVSAIAKFSLGALIVFLPLASGAIGWIYSQVLENRIYIQQNLLSPGQKARFAEEQGVLESLEERTQQKQHFVSPKRLRGYHE